MTPLAYLEQAPRACRDALRWAAPYATLAAAAAACDRINWLLWALEHKCGVARDDVRLRLFSCWCVRNTPLADGRKVWDLLTDERSRAVVEVAERYCDGRATRDDFLAAGNAACCAARSTADTAAWAVSWDATSGVAFDAARSAASASAWAAAWAAAAQAAQCDELRRLFAAEIDETSRRVAAAEGGGA